MAFFQFAEYWVQGLVSARKTTAALSQEPPWQTPENPAEFNLGQIEDEASGFYAQPGQLTIVVSAVPDDSAALADRLGRYLPADTDPVSVKIDQSGDRKQRKAEQSAKQRRRAEIVRRDEERGHGDWGVLLDGEDISRLDLAELRDRIMVVDAGAEVFSGTLQELIDPVGAHTRQQAERVLWTASAEDVWTALPDGWQGVIDERGRGLSGGQRQRLVLARALLADPEVLVMVEPTSAVDAHTEARIADRMPDYRKGRTTILTTVSPLWLRHADRVVLLQNGKAVADGTHAELLRTSPAYRSVVLRGVDEPEVPATTGEAVAE
jgi:ABC-type phosphate transport system ATPase subunit